MEYCDVDDCSEIRPCSEHESVLDCPAQLYCATVAKGLHSLCETEIRSRFGDTIVYLAGAIHEGKVFFRCAENAVEIRQKLRLPDKILVCITLQRTPHLSDPSSASQCLKTMVDDLGDVQLFEWSRGLQTWRNALLATQQGPKIPKPICGSEVSVRLRGKRVGDLVCPPTPTPSASVAATTSATTILIPAINPTPLVSSGPSTSSIPSPTRSRKLAAKKATSATTRNAAPIATTTISDSTPTTSGTLATSKTTGKASAPGGKKKSKSLKSASSCKNTNLSSSSISSLSSPSINDVVTPTSPSVSSCSCAPVSGSQPPDIGLNQAIGSSELVKQLGGLLTKKFHWRMKAEHTDMDLFIDINDSILCLLLELPLKMSVRALRAERYLRYEGDMLRGTTNDIAMTMLGKISPGDVILDPMCGKGTLLLEILLRQEQELEERIQQQSFDVGKVVVFGGVDTNDDEKKTFSHLCENVKHFQKTIRSSSSLLSFFSPLPSAFPPPLPASTSSLTLPSSRRPLPPVLPLSSCINAFSFDLCALPFRPESIDKIFLNTQHQQILLQQQYELQQSRLSPTSLQPQLPRQKSETDQQEQQSESPLSDEQKFYKSFYKVIMEEIYRVLRPKGLFVLLSTQSRVLEECFSEQLPNLLPRKDLPKSRRQRQIHPITINTDDSGLARAKSEKRVDVLPNNFTQSNDVMAVNSPLASETSCGSPASELSPFSFGDEADERTQTCSSSSSTAPSSSTVSSPHAAVSSPHAAESSPHAAESSPHAAESSPQAQAAESEVDQKNSSDPDNIEAVNENRNDQENPVTFPDSPEITPALAALIEAYDNTWALEEFDSDEDVVPVMCTDMVNDAGGWVSTDTALNGPVSLGDSDQEDYHPESNYRRFAKPKVKYFCPGCPYTTTWAKMTKHIEEEQARQRVGKRSSFEFKPSGERKFHQWFNNKKRQWLGKTEWKQSELRTRFVNVPFREWQNQPPVYVEPTPSSGGLAMGMGAWLLREHFRLAEGTYLYCLEKQG